MNPHSRYIGDKVRKAPEVKADLLMALSKFADSELAPEGLKRKPTSIDYKRSIGGAVQVISFQSENTELSLHPAIILRMKEVEDVALEILGGNKLLLANAPEIIVNQPIKITAPISAHKDWLATGPEQILVRVAEVVAFIKEWTIPLLDEVTTPADLVRIMTTPTAEC